MSRKLHNCFDKSIKCNDYFKIELQELCRKWTLNAKGTKEELYDRLLEEDSRKRGEKSQKITTPTTVPTTVPTIVPVVPTTPVTTTVTTAVPVILATEVNNQEINDDLAEFDMEDLVTLANEYGLPLEKENGVGYTKKELYELIEEFNS